MEDANLQELVERFAAILRRQGLQAGLGFLNARTRHRFTGIYRFDPPMLRSVCLFDRENPTLRLGGDALMRETYCSLVGRHAAPFATDNADVDDRLIDHPARASVTAYCGVPLASGDGTCIGTLCHFDLRPRLAPVGEIPLLERAGPLAMRMAATVHVAWRASTSLTTTGDAVRRGRRGCGGR